MITVKEMRELEEKAFAAGITVEELMERAGKECAALIESKLGVGKRIVVFCGPGNNGGDGLVCARYLKKRNAVSVILVKEPATDAAKKNLERAREAGVRTGGGCERIDIIIDAVLGIGARGALRGEIKEASKIINNIEGFRVSIDVPTGMDADTGECDPDAVRPDATICIHAPKAGEIRAGKEKTGDLWVADIGF